MNVIRVDNLKKFFGKTKAVDGISFEVREGEIMGFLGPNGAGKTTTIRCMMDFLRPDEGKIKILGLDAQIDSQKLKRDIGFLPEEDNLYNSWSGRDHINLVKKIRGSKIQEDELVARLKFDPRKKVKTLSTGNKQKLGLILALMHKPKVLILDEPTSGLDPLLQHTIYDILKSEARRGTSIFMSSHNLAEVERICDRACIIKNGKIVTIESISELKNKKLYTIYVYFEKMIPKDMLISERVEIIKEFEDGFMLTVRGDINPLLYKLNQQKLKDLEINHANLEEIFMEHYK
ncbi:MAG: ABC transporter ATP-binding protein [Candidatus Bathyarchaeota archaeon]|nr:ABC transporter ATP-binding protein [Candidatus Bathyarchaeota archaeon]